MISFFLLISTYMLLGSYQFSYRAGQFPRIISAAFIFCTLLLIIRNRENLGLISGCKDKSTNERNISIPVIKRLITTLMIVSYVLIGYLIGLFWITPIFVFVYIFWSKNNWKLALILAVLSTVAVYGFMDMLYLDLATGIFRVVLW